MHKKEERETGRYPMMSHVISMHKKKEREKKVKEVKRPKGINHLADIKTEHMLLVKKIMAKYIGQLVSPTTPHKECELLLQLMVDLGNKEKFVVVTTALESVCQLLTLFLKGLDWGT